VYTLYATDWKGKQYTVSSWHSLPDDVTVSGGVALAPDEVASLSIKDEHQVVLMQGG
jgi:hypothetical protein